MNYSFGNIKVQAEFREEPETKIKSINQVLAEYQELKEETKEHLYAVFLNSGNEVLGDKLLGLGSSSHTPVDVKDIARTAALVNATAVILVHNHPSGNPEPTPADINSTRKVMQALEPLGVELLDHVVIARTGSHSMKQNDNLPVTGDRFSKNG